MLEGDLARKGQDRTIFFLAKTSGLYPSSVRPVGEPKRTQPTPSSSLFSSFFSPLLSSYSSGETPNTIVPKASRRSEAKGQTCSITSTKPEAFKRSTEEKRRSTRGWIEKQEE